jgi:hypothetical protein
MDIAIKCVRMHCRLDRQDASFPSIYVGNGRTIPGSELAMTVGSGYSHPPLVCQQNNDHASSETMMMIRERLRKMIAKATLTDVMMIMGM